VAKKVKHAYMCTIDFDWELGVCVSPSKLYTSVETLKKEHKCAEDCGIVKVRVEVEEVVCIGKGWSY